MEYVVLSFIPSLRDTTTYQSAQNWGQPVSDRTRERRLRISPTRPRCISTPLRIWANAPDSYRRPVRPFAAPPVAFRTKAIGP